MTNLEHYLLGMELFWLALQNTEVKSDWESMFSSPPLWGDVVNQTVWKSNEVNVISDPFRTALPTEAIARAWRRMK